MKRIALVISLLIMATSAFALTLAPKKSYAAPILSAAPVTAPAPKAGFSGVTLTSIGCPAAHFGMGGWSLDVGGSLNSASTLTFTARGNMPLGKAAESVDTYWSPTFMYVSAAGASTITVSLLVGAEYMFAPNLSLFADLTALTLTSAAGVTTWTIGLNNGQIYTGGRLYL